MVLLLNLIDHEYFIHNQNFIGGSAGGASALRTNADRTLVIITDVPMLDRENNTIFASATIQSCCGAVHNNAGVRIY